MNEWSMYMNLAYRQIMREPIISNSQSYHPWLDWWSHHATTSDMQRAVSFPDSFVDKSAVLLVEGDFTTVFNGEEGQYDVLVTLFFIDTARNLLTYLETIHRLLRPGGTWLNLGPLLYGTAPFLQLSLDEVISLARAVGFEFEDPGDVCGDVSFNELPVRSKEISYGRNVRGLNRNGFLAQSWRAIKL
jgi:carnosine N-methyltransferase